MILMSFDYKYVFGRLNNIIEDSNRKLGKCWVHNCPALLLLRFVEN